MTPDMHADAVTIAAELTELRRAIHREPEIGLDLPGTQDKVLQALAGLPLEITRGESLSSVTAVLRGAGPRPGAGPGLEGRQAVLLRGDMDALPVTERTGVSYASRLDGAMHACGHDLHTAMLVGAARLLSARQADLAGDVIFMFQPGEEGSGGALRMIEEGVLTAAGPTAAAAFGLHVTSGMLPLGVTASRPGTLMAAADTLDVTIRGRGGHAAQPHHAADPIPVACEIVTALQTLVTRGFDVFDPVVITVGSFHAGTAENIIPAQAHFLATIRSFSAAARGKVRDAALRLIRQIAAAHGLTADARCTDGYPVTVNDPDQHDFARQTITGMFGAHRYLQAPFPVPAAEDFSFVLERVPGAFIMLGACPPGADPATAPFNHSAEAVFDDAVLPDGAALLAQLAMARLAAA